MSLASRPTARNLEIALVALAVVATAALIRRCVAINGRVTTRLVVWWCLATAVATVNEPTLVLTTVAGTSLVGVPLAWRRTRHLRRVAQVSLVALGGAVSYATMRALIDVAGVEFIRKRPNPIPVGQLGASLDVTIDRIEQLLGFDERVSGGVDAMLTMGRLVLVITAVVGLVLLARRDVVLGGLAWVTLLGGVLAHAATTAVHDPGGIRYLVLPLTMFGFGLFETTRRLLTHALAGAAGDERSRVVRSVYVSLAVATAVVVASALTVVGGTVAVVGRGSWADRPAGELASTVDALVTLTEAGPTLVTGDYWESIVYAYFDDRIEARPSVCVGGRLQFRPYYTTSAPSVPAGTTLVVVVDDRPGLSQCMPEELAVQFETTPTIQRLGPSRTLVVLRPSDQTLRDSGLAVVL